MAHVLEKDSYLADFERLNIARPADPRWLRDLRKQGMERFAAQGFPTTRQEDWKFTSVAPIARTPFVLAPPARLDRGAIEALSFPIDAIELVFVNGRYVPDLSNLDRVPAALTVCGLSSAPPEAQPALEQHLGSAADRDHPFVSLNTAFVQDAAVIVVAPRQIVDRPIHLVYITADPGDAAVAHPRVFVHMGENSQARTIETYAGPAGIPYFTNAVTEVVLAPGAVMDHYRVQREGSGAFHIGGVYVRGDRGATFASHSITMGGALVRNDVVALLGGDGIDCTLNGLYVGNGQALVDNHTTVDHAMPHCGSHEVYKGILGGRARAVFNGKIIVRPDAQKTDAKQTNKALLLSDDATINTKPQLEIFANDVKCTHGAAIGQLDEDAIFYLRARGLDLREARDLLIHAFAGDILNRIRIEPLRERVEQQLMAAIPAH